MSRAYKRAHIRRIERTATHKLTATRIETTTDYDYGSGTSTNEPTVVSDEPVVLQQEMTEYVRTQTGERVKESPALLAKPKLVGELEEADDIVLEPIHADALRMEDLEITSIGKSYDGHGRPVLTVIGLEDV